MAGQDVSQEQMAGLQAMLAQLKDGGLLTGDADSNANKEYYGDDLYDIDVIRDIRYQNEVIMDDDKGMMGGGVDTASDFTNHYGGAPKQYTATQEEQYNSSQPPGGDYTNWQWAGPYGWVYKGNEADGTLGKSSYINDAGQRVHHDPVPSLQRDNEWWDSKRATIGLAEAWASGGDQFLREGGLYDRESNPYVETQAIRNANQAALANSPSGGGVYDPTTDTTYFGGMHYQGDMTQGKTQADFTPEAWSSLENNDRYYTGKGQLSPEGYKYISDAVGRTGNGNPFISTYDHDVDRQLQYLGDSNWNPFYGDRGRVHQDMFDRNRELGTLGEGLTDYEKRREGNIADYMMDAFRDSSMIKHRGGALRNWAKWKSDNRINEKSLYARRMDQGTFNKLGLGDMGLTFDSSYGRPNVASGGFNTDVNQGGSASAQVKQGGFLDTYLKRREENKPSVMSLMQELEDS